MFKIEIGKNKGNSFTCPFGMLEVNINEKHKNMSLGQIAQNLAYQYKINNGSITLESISFTYEKGKD